MIMYIYKTIIHLVDNPGIQISYNTRTKIKVTPKCSNTAPAWVRKARTSSLFFQGPLLYNAIPAELRELEDIPHPTKENVENFKRKLDKWLASVPDIPGTLTNSQTHKLYCSNYEDNFVQVFYVSIIFIYFCIYFFNPKKPFPWNMKYIAN